MDICPAVFEAGSYLESLNKGSYKDPRVHKIIMDGKNFALLSDQKFDIIMNDSIYPGARGSSALYGYDHFRNCRERLNKGGLFSCWVPVDLQICEMQMILKSFQTVFPHTSLWIDSNCLNKHALILGSAEPFQFDLKRIQEIISKPLIRGELATIDIQNAYDFMDCFVMDEKAVKQFTKDAPLNTDNHPLLEISCAVPKDWKGKLMMFLGQVVSYHSPILPYLKEGSYTADDANELDKRFQATTHLFSAMVAQLFAKPVERFKQLRLALEKNPEEIHVKSINQELQREIDQYLTVLQTLPNHPDIMRGLGESYYLAYQYDKAREVYEKVFELDPMPPDDKIYINLAEIYYSQKRPDDAKKLLNQCLAVWPKASEAHDRLGGIFLREGDRTKAKYHIQLALEQVPDSPVYNLHYQLITDNK